MAVIYVGASNKHLGLSQYTIYKEKPTALIETLKAKIPLIERLFILVEDLAEIEKELERPETIIYKAWEQAKEAR